MLFENSSADFISLVNAEPTSFSYQGLINLAEEDLVTSIYC